MLICWYGDHQARADHARQPVADAWYVLLLLQRRTGFRNMMPLNLRSFGAGPIDPAMAPRFL
jgi:hypothetical protein